MNVTSIIQSTAASPAGAQASEGSGAKGDFLQVMSSFVKSSGKSGSAVHATLAQSISSPQLQAVLAHMAVPAGTHLAVAHAAEKSEASGQGKSQSVSTSGESKTLKPDMQSILEGIFKGKGGDEDSPISSTGAKQAEPDADQAKAAPLFQPEQQQATGQTAQSGVRPALAQSVVDSGQEAFARRMTEFAETEPATEAIKATALQSPPKTGTETATNDAASQFHSPEAQDGVRQSDASTTANADLKSGGKGTIADSKTLSGQSQSPQTTEMKQAVARADDALLQPQAPKFSLKIDAGQQLVTQPKGAYSAPVTADTAAASSSAPVKPTQLASTLSQFVDQIRTNATVTAGNLRNGTMELQLDPPSLGKLTLQVVMDANNNAMKVNLTAMTPDAKSILDQHAGTLKSQLVSQGLNIQDLNISLGQHSRQPNAQRPDFLQFAGEKDGNGAAIETAIATPALAGATTVNYLV